MANMEIIIMTESSKFGQKCVAGIDTSSGRWVRLVSDDEVTHGAISNEDLICSNGKMCKVLDIVNVPIIRKCGSMIQPENVLIDTSKYIDIVGKATFSDVLNIHPAEVRFDILGNKYAYVTEQKVGRIGYSLALVKVNNLKIVQTENRDGKPKTKANFRYQGEDYENMSVTDPDFYSVPNGTLYNTAYLVISIGTPHENKYYKFVSGIFV